MLRRPLLDRTAEVTEQQLEGKFHVTNFGALVGPKLEGKRKNIDEAFRLHCINTVLDRKKARTGQSYIRASDTELDVSLVHRWIIKELQAYQRAVRNKVREQGVHVFGVASDGARVGADPPVESVLGHLFLPQHHLPIVPRPQDCKSRMSGGLQA